LRLKEFLTLSYLDKMADANAPKDPYKMAYIIFYWLGIGSLLPWNFFIAVDAYWKHKFRNTSIPIGQETHMTDLQVQWASNLSIASMIPNVTFLLLNAFIGHKIRAFPRLMTALVIIILTFIFTTVMAKVNTDDWQYTFLGVTLASVVVINIMVAIFQGGLSGLAGKFPPNYMGAVVQGQALGGIFAAASNVIILSFGANDVDAAFYDFLIAVIFLVSALIAFIVLTRSEFYQFYSNETVSENKDAEDKKENVENEQLIDNNGEGGKVEVLQPMSSLDIVKRIWVWILSVFICFFVTLAVFPAITVLVKSTGHGNQWSDKYFIPVGCFLVFNIGDYVGRMLASIVKWPQATHGGSLIILIVSVVRIAFIPLFLLCNAAPHSRSVTDVYIPSDTAYLIFMVIFSISNGYIGSIAMMYGPKMLQNGVDQGRAASFLVSFLVLGLAVGAAMSGLIVQLL